MNSKTGWLLASHSPCGACCGLARRGGPAYITGARELDAAHVLNEAQTKAVQYVARLAKSKSEDAEENLRR